MPCLIITLLACTIVSAKQPLTQPIRLDSGGESWPAVLTPDGKSLLGLVKNGDHCDIVVWDTASKSKSFLVKGSGGIPLAVSPNRQSVAGVILTNIANDTCDVEIVIWDIEKRSTTEVLKLKKGTWIPSGWPVFPCQTVDFSCDSTLFAFADGYTKKAHLWKRGAAGAWRDLKTLDLAQRADGPKPALLEVKFSRDGRQLFAFVPIGKADEPLSSVATERWDIASGRPVACAIQPAEVFVFFTGPFPHILGEKTLCFQAPEGVGGGVVGVNISSGKRKYDVSGFTLWARPSPDGKTCGDIHWRLMGVEPGPVTVGFWNFDDGTQRRTVELSASDEPPIATFTPDSRYFLCTAGSGGRSVFLIDAKTAKIRSSWKADAPVRGLFLLNSGEVAAVGVGARTS